MRKMSESTIIERAQDCVQIRSCIQEEVSATDNLTGSKQEHPSQLHPETLLQSAFFVDNIPYKLAAKYKCCRNIDLVLKQNYSHNIIMRSQFATS